MARIRKVVFEAVNTNGNSARIGKIKADYIHGISFQYADNCTPLPSDTISARSSVGNICLIHIGDDGDGGTFWFDEPVPTKSFYLNLNSTPNRFLPEEVKRVYGVIHVS